MTMQNFLKPTFLLLTLAVPFTQAEGAALTHLGQKPDNHVTLVAGHVDTGKGKCAGASFKDRAFFQVFTDGTLAKEPFVVPAKRYLVVTDVAWSAYGGGQLVSLQAGNSLHLDIGLLDVANGASGAQPVFSSSPLVLDANAATAVPGATEHLVSGFLVGPAVEICPSAGQRQPSYGAVAYVDKVTLHGYLIAKPGK